MLFNTRACQCYDRAKVVEIQVTGTVGLFWISPSPVAKPYIHET